MTIELRHRSELLAYTVFATLGAYWCYDQHCWTGHVVHDRFEYDRIMPWIGDALWLFFLCAAMVVALKGRFDGARPMGIALLFLVLCMFIFRSPLGLLGAIYATILTVIQTVTLIGAKINKQAEQGGDGDAEEAV